MIGVDNTSPMIGHDMTKSIDESKLRAMMQFYKNYAWMDNNNDVVIFQPERAAAGFRYDEKTTQLSNKKLPENMIEMARANALWGSLAYKNDYYQAKTQ
jgi:hypothetical protein